MTDGSRPPTTAADLWVCHLGTVPYEVALAAQERVREQRQRGVVPDALLLLEHPPVLTAGRRADATELPLPAAFYAARGIALHEVDRGGRITYHGPGQLVGYPIMAVEDVRAYVRTMEGAIVAALAEEGVSARARADEGADYTGVWVDERKIASIGVHVQRGVTTHGFAVNVDNDLEPFTWIVACGLPDVAMTSLARERGLETAALPCFRRRVAHSFCLAHGRRQRLVTPRALGIAALLAAGRSERGREPVPA